MSGRGFNWDYLVIDRDARLVAGPQGPLVVTWEEGQRLIAEAADDREPGAPMELASCDQWVAVFGPDPFEQPGDPGTWTLKHRGWK